MDGNRSVLEGLVSPQEDSTQEALIALGLAPSPVDAAKLSEVLGVEAGVAVAKPVRVRPMPLASPALSAEELASLASVLGVAVDQPTPQELLQAEEDPLQLASADAPKREAPRSIAVTATERAEERLQLGGQGREWARLMEAGFAEAAGDLTLTNAAIGERLITALQRALGLSVSADLLGSITMRWLYENRYRLIFDFGTGAAMALAVYGLLPLLGYAAPGFSLFTYAKETGYFSSVWASLGGALAHGAFSTFKGSIIRELAKATGGVNVLENESIQAALQKLGVPEKYRSLYTQSIFHFVKIPVVTAIDSNVFNRHILAPLGMYTVPTSVAGDAVNLYGYFVLANYAISYGPGLALATASGTASVAATILKGTATTTYAALGELVRIISRTGDKVLEEVSTRAAALPKGKGVLQRRLRRAIPDTPLDPQDIEADLRSEAEDPTLVAVMKASVDGAIKSQLNAVDEAVERQFSQGSLPRSVMEFVVSAKPDPPPAVLDKGPAAIAAFVQQAIPQRLLTGAVGVIAAAAMIRLGSADPGMLASMIPPAYIPSLLQIDKAFEVMARTGHVDALIFRMVVRTFGIERFVSQMLGRIPFERFHALKNLSDRIAAMGVEAAEAESGLAHQFVNLVMGKKLYSGSELEGFSNASLEKLHSEVTGKRAAGFAVSRQKRIEDILGAQRAAVGSLHTSVLTSLAAEAGTSGLTAALQSSSRQIYQQASALYSEICKMPSLGLVTKATSVARNALSALSSSPELDKYGLFQPGSAYSDDAAKLLRESGNEVLSEAYDAKRDIDRWLAEAVAKVAATKEASPPEAPGLSAPPKQEELLDEVARLNGFSSKAEMAAARQSAAESHTGVRVGGAVYEDMRAYYASLEDATAYAAAEAQREASEADRLAKLRLSSVLEAIHPTEATNAANDRSAFTSAQRLSEQVADQAERSFKELRTDPKFSDVSDEQLRSLLGESLRSVLYVNPAGSVGLAPSSAAGLAAPTEEPLATGQRAPATATSAIPNPKPLRDMTGTWLDPISDVIAESAIQASVSSLHTTLTTMVKSSLSAYPLAASAVTASLNYPTLAKYYNRGKVIARVARAVALSMDATKDLEVVKNLPRPSEWALPELPSFTDLVRSTRIWQDLKAERRINVESVILKNVMDFFLKSETDRMAYGVPRLMYDIAKGLAGPITPGIVQSAYDKILGPEVSRIYNVLMTEYNTVHGTSFPTAVSAADLVPYESGGSQRTGGSLFADQLTFPEVKPTPPPASGIPQVPLAHSDRTKLPVALDPPESTVPFAPQGVSGAPLFPAVSNEPAFMRKK